MISLGGISGSPEFTASSEWRKFQENYDKEGVLLAEIFCSVCNGLRVYTYGERFL